MNDTTEILKAARQLIEKREDWWDGSGDWTAQPTGTVCAVQTMATSLQELERIDYPTASIECFGALINALPPTLRRHGLATYNDTHSHEDVLALFDRAIAATECAEDE